MSDRLNAMHVRGAVLLTAAIVGVAIAPTAHAGSGCTQPAANCQSPDQMGQGAGGTVGATSDANANAGFSVADNFQVVSSGNITGACWWGFYVDFPDMMCGPVIDDFTVTYFADTLQALPGAIIGGPFDVTVDRNATGAVIPTGIGDLTEFVYTTTHAPVPVTAGECYWIEVQNNTSGECLWLWSAAPPGDNRSAQDADMDGYEASEVDDYDLAFCINLAIQPDGGCPPQAPPLNDNCNNATLAGEGMHAFTTINAITDGPADNLCNVNGSSQITGDVWFRYDAPCSGMVTASVCGADFNSRIAAYQGFCPSAANTAIACNDDGCADDGTITFAVNGGTSYRIRIGGFMGAQGSGVLVIDGPDCVPAPPNNNCGSATTLNLGSTPFNTAGATTDGPTETCGAIVNDIWYRHLSSCDGQLTVSVCGASYDTRIAVYGAACPGATPNTAIACNDNACGTASEVSWNANAGSIYRIRIGGAGVTTGSGTIMLSCGAAPPCPEDSNNDGVVNVDDLVTLISQWGCPSPPCSADNNDDGTVNVDDLVNLISAWGDC